MLSLTDLLGRIQSGALSPDAAIGLSVDAIASSEARIGAFVHLVPDARASGRGPLNGIAVGVKDIIDTANMPTQMGSSTYAGWQPKADAPVVAALRRAGATILGKTTTTAFAYSDPTETRNPHDPAHTPGGSSAGSAAAVGGGMIPLALGTQTGGSVIRPASFCGAAAIKPSFRLIPTVGVKCYAWTLDTVGLFAATVGDLVTALAIITERPIALADNRRPRVGLVMQDFAGAPDPEAAHALDVAAATLARAGAEVTPLALPASLGEAWSAHPIIQAFEAKASLAWEYTHHRDALPPLLGRQLDEAQSTSGEAYDAARRLANRARREAGEALREVDAIITYAAPGPAPRGLASTGDARYNRLWTMLGTPAVNVPGLRSAAGLPIGIQVIAPFARDAVALDVALQLERALIAHRS